MKSDWLAQSSNTKKTLIECLLNLDSVNFSRGEFILYSMLVMFNIHYLIVCIRYSND